MKKIILSSKNAPTHMILHFLATKPMLLSQQRFFKQCSIFILKIIKYILRLLGIITDAF